MPRKSRDVFGVLPENNNRNLEIQEKLAASPAKGRSLRISTPRTHSTDSFRETIFDIDFAPLFSNLSL
jgi:hypothetical protein